LSVGEVEGLLKSDDAGRLKVGDQVDVYIIDIDSTSRRLNVSLDKVVSDKE
jgi:ribosomal protein S1